MTAGAAAWAALVGLIGMLVLACVGDLASEEVRGRLERLPHALIALAARRAPPEMRAELREEWAAELHEILRGAEGLPITRLVRGIQYAAGVLRTARGVGRQLSPNHGRIRTGPSRFAALARDAAFATRRIAAADDVPLGSAIAIINGLAIAITNPGGSGIAIASGIISAIGSAIGIAIVIAIVIAIKRRRRDKESRPDPQVGNAPPYDPA
jgi:hypothetical protein